MYLFLFVPFISLLPSYDPIGLFDLSVDDHLF